MFHQNPSQWLAGLCLFHDVPTKQFKQHLRLCIYSHCLWRETPSPLHSCGWAAVAASPGSQREHPSHTQKLQTFIMGKTLNCDTTRQKKRQIKPSNKQTHVLCTGQSQESCWSIQVTPPEHSPGEEGEGEGLSRAAVPLPTTVPGTLCCSHRSAPAPSPFPKWAQRQVKSELTSHKLERIIIPTSN